MKNLNLDLDQILKDAYYNYCIDNNLDIIITFNAPYFEEYNSDTSAQLYRNMDEDIVRTANINEIAELEDKELLR